MLAKRSNHTMQATTIPALRKALTAAGFYVYSQPANACRAHAVYYVQDDRGCPERLPALWKADREAFRQWAVSTLSTL